jgi:hypothetical protein
MLLFVEAARALEGTTWVLQRGGKRIVGEER